MEDVILKKESWLGKFFSLQGRLNRKKFIVRDIRLGVIMLIVYFFLMYLLFLMGVDVEGAGNGIFMVWNAVAVCMGIPLALRRLHDLDQPGWWLIGYFLGPIVPGSVTIVLAVINVYCFALSIYLLFFRGTKGPNRYGEDPIVEKPQREEPFGIE